MDIKEANRFYWNLARTFFGISCFWSNLGILCNSMLLLTTVRTRTLRSTYNILIGICAIGDVFHQIGNLVQLPLLLDIYLEIDSLHCVIIMFLPEMGIAVGCASILCIGLDRMVSVIFSLRYRTLNRPFYYSFLAFLILAYCSYFTFLMAYFFQARKVVCEVVTPFLGLGYTWFTIGNFSVNALSAIVYLIIWIGLRSQNDSALMKRIMKPLLTVVAVDTSGWFLTPGLTTLFQLLELPQHQFFAFTYFATMFIHIALSIKLFIYYTMSSEYRSALNSLLFNKSNPSKQSNSTASGIANR